MATTQPSPPLRASLLLLCLAVGCSRGVASPREPPASAAPDAPRMVRFAPDVLGRLGVVVAPAGSAAGEARLLVPGTLEYNMERYAEVGVLQEGRVTALAVRVGDRVRKGQALATVVVPSLAAAQAEFLSAQAAHEVARQNASREESLLKEGATSAREREVARGEEARTVAQLRAATARLRGLGASIPDGHAAMTTNGTVTLTAPIDGVVVRRDAVIGAYLLPDEKAFIIADPNELWATIDVYESDLHHFHKGAEVDLTIEALGQQVRGHVSLVEPHLGAESRALRARIAVDNADHRLRPGLFVRAALRLPEGAPGALRVPAAAVQPVGSEDVAFVERELGAFEVRRVRVGRRTAQVVEIIEGLAQGERIATAGTFLLRGELTKQ